MVLLLVLVASGSAVWSAPTPSPSEEQRHASGVSLVPAGPSPVLKPMPEDVLFAQHKALELVYEQSSELAYPWVDRQSGELVLDTVTPAGQQFAAALRSKHSAIPVRMRSVSRSYSALERIKDDATYLVDRGVPDADAIFKTAPDSENNRIIISVKRLADELLYALAAMYGTDAIAVQHVPNPPVSLPQPRDYDTSPFWGGAKINAPSGATCTDAFSWVNGSAPMMLTAGHCSPNGGHTSTPASGMGWVTAASEESWNNGVGTVYLTGSVVYRGDIALIRMYNANSSEPKMYRGGAGSGTFATVTQMWTRQALAGDSYCTGGYVSGELCGWQVVQTGINYQYGSGAWARNVVTGGKQGWCTRPGDSGGPIYTVGPTGVSAKGIHSGGGGGGGDYYGGLTDPCVEVFTDIYQAYYGFPGVLKTF